MLQTLCRLPGVLLVAYHAPAGHRPDCRTWHASQHHSAAERCPRTTTLGRLLLSTFPVSYSAACVIACPRPRHRHVPAPPHYPSGTCAWTALCRSSGPASPRECREGRGPRSLRARGVLPAHDARGMRHTSARRAYTRVCATPRASVTVRHRHAATAQPTRYPPSQVAVP